MKKEKPAEKETPLALISEEDLSLVGENLLNKDQLQFILRKTPPRYIRQRTIGNKTFDYVTGGYIKKCLNLMLGWRWQFEITDKWTEHGCVIVEGKLTCWFGEKVIVKSQFGSKVIELNDKGVPVDIGFDYKSGATDCLKKCAAELGIAADIYNADDFREIIIGEKNGSLDWKALQSLYDQKLADEKISIDDQIHCERILKDQEKHSYYKLKEKLELLK